MMLLDWVLLVWSVVAFIVLVFLTWAWMREKDDELSTGWGLLIILLLSVSWFVSIPFMVLVTNKVKKM